MEDDNEKFDKNEKAEKGEKSTLHGVRSTEAGISHDVTVDPVERLLKKQSYDKEKVKLIDKIFSEKKEKPFSKRLLAEYKPTDDTTIEVSKLLDKRKKNAPKTILEKAEEQKMGIERRLEDSDKQLSELIQLGNELVTNIKVANERREVARRNLEAVKREDLLAELDAEQNDVADKYTKIIRRWRDLKNLKEPMGLYEAMEKQKQRIDDLMNRKKDFINKCQDEIKRVDEKYYEDLEKQGADIYCLVERIDNQLELMKNAYNDHLELLQKTIGEERETLALTAERKWEELFNRRGNNESKKEDIEKEKAKLYAQEIERIAKEHEEITRATRIRLEKDAENLQLELRSVKNNVLLNSEKLDYNYQVLQKRDEENVIIRNQQKRRLAKINETISTLKKKVKTIKAYSEAEMKKLSKEVLHLHSSIIELESKSKNFTVMNDKKYQSVWDINYQEALQLINKVFDIDKILHEQQLGLEWIRPNVPFLKMKDLPSCKAVGKQIKLNSPSMRSLKPKQSKFSMKQPSAIISAKTDEQKLADTRLLRNILRRISERAGFLLEDKLLSILSPYSEEQTTLVRLDNIFAALEIKDMDQVNSLVEYFLPYTWCPNCSKDISPNVLNKIYQLESDPIPGESKKDLTIYTSDAPSIGSRFRDNYSMSRVSGFTESLEEDVSSTDESERNIEILLRGKLRTEQKYLKESKKPVQFDMKSYSTINRDCPNHVLVIEPVLVLTALRKFAEEHFCSYLFSFGNDTKIVDILAKSPTTISRVIGKQDVITFWAQFSEAISEQKQKLWKSLEHGLNHYLKVLKERESLDAQCEFLRRQNLELKHLLQKYIPKQCNDAI